MVHVAGEVPGLCVGLAERVRGDLRVVLGGGRRPVFDMREPGLQLEQGHRLFGVVELVGAENLCHQAIFMYHAPCAVAPLDPGLIHVCDAVG